MSKAILLFPLNHFLLVLKEFFCEAIAYINVSDIVLYQGYVKPSQYKSYCTSCGQRNYKSVSETGQSRCGRCGDDARVDYIKPPLEIGTYPGKSTDMYEDFEDWEMYQLRERVRLVCEFDELCDAILATVVDLVDNYEIDEEVVMRPHTVKFLREVAS